VEEDGKVTVLRDRSESFSAQYPVIGTVYDVLVSGMWIGRIASKPQRTSRVAKRGRSRGTDPMETIWFIEHYGYEGYLTRAEAVKALLLAHGQGRMPH